MRARKRERSHRIGVGQPHLAQLLFPPIVTLPPMENALTESSLFKTMTKSVRSAPIRSPRPSPSMPIQDGVDHELSGNRAITTPGLAIPQGTEFDVQANTPASDRTGCGVHRYPNHHDFAIPFSETQIRHPEVEHPSVIPLSVLDHFRMPFCKVV